MEPKEERRHRRRHGEVVLPTAGEGVIVIWIPFIRLTTRSKSVFIAMNRFRVNPERTDEFEQIWLERETHLQDLPGFVEFHMLRGPEKEDHVLYASHTIWRSREDFEAWTHSEAFRKAHANAGQSKREGLYLGPPNFEGFEVIQTVGNASNA